MPYRKLEAVEGVRTNNGVEALNNVLKHKVLHGVSAHRSLPQLVASLVYDFIPNKLQTYRHKVFIKWGVKGDNVWEHDFKITCDPKVPQRGSTFCSVFLPQTLRRSCHAHFTAKNDPKNRN